MILVLRKFLKVTLLNHLIQRFVVDNVGGWCFFGWVRTLRYIFGCMQRAAMTKWPGERLVKTRVVSGFIFLRLICPSLLNPRQFNLVSGEKL
jgi:hypothetical protein